MDWTERQREAIETKGKNLLVAAAAGSGKTAVLVERIRRTVMEENVPVDRLLVVTFTNKAAAEMKEKIVKSLTAEIEKDPQHSGFLRAQLNSMYKADVCTFHAFALSVIRRYYYIIGAEPGFSVSDEAENKIMQGDAVDRLFASRFETDGEAFRAFLDRYAQGRSLDGVKKLIVSTYEKVMSVPEPEAFLAACAEKTVWTQEDLTEGVLGALLRQEIEEKLTLAQRGYENAQRLLSDSGLDGLAAKVGQEVEYVQRLLAAAEGKDCAAQSGLDAVAALLSNPVSVRLAAGKEEKEIYGEIRDSVKQLRSQAGKYLNELRTQYFAYDPDEYLAELSEASGFTRYFCGLLADFGALYGEEKKEKKKIDFSDIEHMALSILADERVAAEYRARIEYIYIDEYQDSNLIQEALIARIRRADNLFMVGDVKQSIYKFRLAEPEIFLEKYERYRGGGEPESVKIDLNTNFRSKTGVIESVNRIFGAAMKGYDEDAALHRGVSGSEAETKGFKTELHLLYDDEADDLPEELAEMKETEREACIAAELIRRAVGKPVYDMKQGAWRPLRKRDIVILMRGVKTGGAVYQKVLGDRGVPCHMEESDGYFDTVEIDVFLSLLRVIDNRRQDTPLLSALYSPVFGFTADELAEIRTARKEGSYYEAFAAYGISGRDVRLREKCAAAEAQIDRWAAYAAVCPLSDFLWQMMWQTGYYIYVGGLPAGSQRQANLRTLADRAAQFSEGRAGSIYEFLRYIDRMKERGVPTGQTSLLSENDDVVRIMTIHKSKGLEFPMVILAGMGKRFRYRQDRSAAAFHKQIGLGLDLVRPAGRWRKKTLLQKLIYAKTDREFAEEELRILYVGCTRAMDRLVLLGSTRRRKEQLDLYSYLNPKDILAASCYLDIVLPALGDETDVYLHGGAELSGMLRTEAEETDRLHAFAEAPPREPETEAQRALYREIDRRLSYRYPYSHEVELKSKYSVTEIASGAWEDPAKASPEGAVAFSPENAAVPLFLAAEQGAPQRRLTGAELGTVYHSVIEHLDLARLGALLAEQGDAAAEPFVRALLAELTEKEILLAEEAAAVRPQKICELLLSPLGRRMMRAASDGTLLREAPFTVKHLHAGAEILVQGVIDCLFCETRADGSEAWVLVDYKTNYAADERDVARLKAQYQAQISLYCEAVEKAKGVCVGEAYLWLFSLGRAVPMEIE